MSDNEINLSDSMFNFDFLSSEDPSAGSAGSAGKAPSADEPFDNKATLEDSQKLPAKEQSDPASAEEADTADRLITFDSDMERNATSYFTLAAMRELMIVPAHFDIESSTLYVFCHNHPDEELPLKLEALLVCQHPLKIALQSDSTDNISALISRIEKNTQVFDSIDTSANSSPTSIPEPAVEMQQASDAVQETEAPAAEQVQSPALTPAPIPEPTPIETEGDAAKSQCALFVTPSGGLSSHMLFAIRAEKIEPIIVHDCKSAIETLSDRSISLVLVHSSLMSHSNDLRIALQDKSERILIRYYDSEAGLLTGAVHDCETIELFEKNLRFASYLADSPDNALHGHGATVAELCQRLSGSYSLSSSLQLSLITAAHWHDIAARDLKTPAAYSHSDIVALSASRLESLDSPYETVQLLKIMSQPKLNTGELDSEILLAGCILALSDHYSHNWPAPANVSKEQFIEIRSDLKNYSLSLARPEVVDSLVSIIESDIEESAPANGASVVQILDLTCGKQASLLSNLQEALNGADFSCVVSYSVAECSQRWASADTQALIALHSGNVQEITDSLFALALKGVNFENSPSILLTSDEALEKVIWSIKHGIEDVFPFSISPDILITKLNRSQKRLQELSHVRISALQDMGTHGSLEDMNLIKLLEASRDSSRPLRISATAQGSQLIAFVENNRVVNATCDELIGIEAISQSIDWKQGIWSIDPIAKKDLPQQNLGLTIDSVMLKACVQCDITAHTATGQAVS